jgi:hypothetical protein
MYKSLGARGMPGALHLLRAVLGRKLLQPYLWHLDVHLNEFVSNVAIGVTLVLDCLFLQIEEVVVLAFLEDYWPEDPLNELVREEDGKSRLVVVVEVCLENIIDSSLDQCLIDLVLGVRVLFALSETGI